MKDITKVVDLGNEKALVIFTKKIKYHRGNSWMIRKSTVIAMQNNEVDTLVLVIGDTAYMASLGDILKGVDAQGAYMVPDATFIEQSVKDFI